MSQVYIWDQTLTSDEMDNVMYAMMHYLDTGKSLKTLESASIAPIFGCSACPGNYTTVAMGSSLSQCACLAGYYDDGSGTSTCLQCPALTSSSFGSTSLSQCVCIHGYYDDGTGIRTCLRCPHLTTTRSVGATSLSQCVPYAPLVSYQFEDPNNLGYDSSGNGYNATNYGATQGPGRRGDGAAKFSAADTEQYMTMPNKIDFGIIQQSTGLTVAFWGYMTTFSSMYARFIDFGGGPNNESLAIYPNGAATAPLTFAVLDGATPINISYDWIPQYWHHIALSINPNDGSTDQNKISIWIDGLLVCNACQQGLLSSVTTVSSRQWYIAKANRANGKTDGSIDDFRIYNYPFTQFDVEQHYLPLYYPTGCLSQSYNPNALFAFYPELVASANFPGVANLNAAVSSPLTTFDDAFRQLVASDKYGTIVWVCYDCDLAHWLTFYKRILPVDPDWSMSQQFLYRWIADRNTPNIHVKFYTNEADYLADNSATLFDPSYFSMTYATISTSPSVAPTVIDSSYSYLTFTHVNGTRTNYSVTFPQDTVIDYLIIGGGGGGGANGGGGGGAGGLIYKTGVLVKKGTQASSGQQSSFNGDIAVGGGGGGGSNLGFETAGNGNSVREAEAEVQAELELERVAIKVEMVVQDWL
ncbi:hypothetical protein GUITHDRAFT_110303 [Guillardia theta CCMP2712]|uniref:Uncharacterized protein n=1 Tax=Guillardia theta (strain CCMP2712) TaxID=905079 RepID=L1J6B9_GUITC|nr:hypothetical protein GUITHDRAFT_110303 [Guillardia theta CCMP2712]EKX43852.1 hypothetical protein GUITHDRAFT_110303 [Guillardia theta CCMP2712]|eukprot:XP_005830832.1 hypothetical protein GUITHDRAFT_110303 [Guillardia theta CCMP2712]